MDIEEEKTWFQNKIAKKLESDSKLYLFGLL